MTDAKAATPTDASATAARLNSLHMAEWMAQPLSLRVALDVLNPETSGTGRTPLEQELAQYIVDLHQRDFERAFSLTPIERSFLIAYLSDFPTAFTETLGDLDQAQLERLVVLSRLFYRLREAMP